MASQIFLENFYQTVLTSPTIAASWDVTFTVATPPTYQKGWIVMSSENAAKREVMYYHSVSGSTISVRGVNRINPKEHTQNEIVRINDVAEIFNFITGQISTAFYVEKTGWLDVTVWWGVVTYNGAAQSFNDTNLTLANNATNYIKYDYPTNTISVDTSNTGNIKAIVVTLSGSITSISYLTPKESFIDFTVSLTDALPSQAWHAWEALVTDGTNVSWSLAFLNTLRSSLSNWKLLFTNGTWAEWYVDMWAANTVLTSNGATSAPTFQSLPYASQAEAEAGTDNVKLMTPLRVAQAVPAASETVAGKVERATDAEVATWTDTTRYVSPAQLTKYVNWIFTWTANKNSYVDITISWLPRAAKNITITTWQWAYTLTWFYNWTTYAWVYFADTWYSTTTRSVDTTNTALFSYAYDVENTINDFFNYSLTVQSITSSTVVLRLTYTWESSAAATRSIKWTYNIEL